MSELRKDLGDFEHVWINGYNGQNAYFVDQTTVIYACDSAIKIASTKSKDIKTYIPFNPSENINVKLLTANSIHNKFAFSDSLMPSTVYIKDLTNFTHVAQLDAAAMVEFLFIEFSNSDYLLTVSGVPELKLIVWNWKTGEKLTDIQLNEDELPLNVCFSPTNWRHISVAYENHVEIWKIEQCDEEIKKSKTNFNLPPVISGEVIEANNEIDFNGNQTGKEPYPNSVIAGVDEKLEDDLDELLDKNEKQKFQSSCWGIDDDVYVATNLNHVYRYVMSTSSLSLVFAQLDTSTDASDTKKITFEKTTLSQSTVYHSLFNITGMFLHKKGVLVSCSDGRIRFINIEAALSNPLTELKVMYDMHATKISNLSANSDFSILSISTEKGIYVTNISNENFRDQRTIVVQESSHDIKQIVDYNYGVVVGLENINPLNDNFLLLKANGAVQTWSISQGIILHTLHLNTKCNIMTAHPYMPLAVVGAESGHIIIIDCSDYKMGLRIIGKIKLHQKGVKRLKFNTSGTLLFSVGAENRLFIIDTRLNEKPQSIIVKQDQKLMNKNDSHANAGFYVLGYLEFENDLVSFDTIDMFNETTKTISTRFGLAVFETTAAETIRKIQNEKDTSLSEQQQAVRADFHNNLINSSKTNENLHKLACRVTLYDINFDLFEDKNRLYSNINKLEFREEALSKHVVYTQYFFNSFRFLARNYILAFVNRNIVKFSIPEIDPNKKAAKLPHLEFVEIFATHELPHGGLIRTLNNQFIFTAGYDGVLSVRSANDSKQVTEMRGHHHTNGGYHFIALTQDLKTVISVGRDMHVMIVKWICDRADVQRDIAKLPIEGDFDRQQVRRLPSVPDSKNELSWLEARDVENHKIEDQNFLPVKNEIIKGLEDIKVRLQDLMKVNRTREDIARLEEHEFYLDLEELERLHKDADLKIQAIREAKDFENTANLFLKEVIKKECWDRMRVKGRGIESFSGNMFVENYALKERSKAELKLLERVQMLRRIEIAEEKSKKDILAELTKKENTHSLTEPEEDESKDNENTNSNSNMSQNQNQGLTPFALKGSVGSLFDGESPYFYNQFELFSNEQKWMQIILIQDAIFKIKENFNKEFENVMQRKLQEIGKVKEKNQRIKQIYVDLNEEKSTKEPTLTDLENPEMLFDVKDEEIKVEKYLTAEQRKLLEDQLAEEERRRELERMDNWRERGLMEMMGGVLQIRREDELKKDIPVPSFVKEKPQEEWSADEVKQYQIYEQKVKELNDEREKLRKQLNAELVKLQEQMQESFQNFDGVLLQLHIRKIRTQQAIYQEELKIVRLLNSIIINSELEKREHQLIRKFESAKETRKELTQEITRIKKSIEAFKDGYETLVFEDKALEKSFTREFADVSAGLREQLSKLFRKRVKARFQVTKTNLNPQNIYLAELGANNPYAERPSTAQQILSQDIELEKSLNEMDAPNNAPIGIDNTVWERFINFRRQKIELENTIKWKGMLLSEMNLYFQKRMEEDEQKKREAEEYQRNLILIQELRLKANHNLQIQFIIKQGQVETEPGANVHNFENCLLINQSAVNALNKVIQSHGKQKISIMVECKDFKKGIRQLEWEHRKMRMQIEDFLQKQKDITYLKLTREVQEYLNSEDYDAKKQKEINVLEQTIAYQAEQYKKKYGEQNTRLKKVTFQSVKIANDNRNLDDKLDEANVMLHEKKHIKDELAGQNVERTREERFKQITQRRKFVDLAKAQAQEVAFLRSEVERLRMKTFPALVQIEF